MHSIYWLDKWNNTQLHNGKDIDVVMSIYNFIEYTGIYSKTSGRLWQYCTDEPAVIEMVILLNLLMLMLLICLNLEK